MLFVLPIAYARYLTETLYNLILEPSIEDVRNEISYADELINLLRMVLQQVREACKCIQLYIWFDQPVLLSDRRFYLRVD